MKIKKSILDLIRHQKYQNRYFQSSSGIRIASALEATTVSKQQRHRQHSTCAHGFRCLGSRINNTVHKNKILSRADGIGAETTASLPAFFSTGTSDEDKNRPKIALVVGSSGALGATISKYLSRDLGMVVLGADVVGNKKESESDYLEGFIQMESETQNQTLTTERIITELSGGLQYFLNDNSSNSDEPAQLDAIICASGGWKPNPDLPMNIELGGKKYGAVIDEMISRNLYPVLASGYVAQHYMGRNGLFIAFGATASLSTTPDMIGYGLSKSAVHHYVQTMGTLATDKNLDHKSKRIEAKRSSFLSTNNNMETMTCVGILPPMIDTVSNRRDAIENGITSNFEDWAKPKEIAKEIGTWIKVPPLRPHSGSLVKVFTTKHNGTVFDIVR